MRKKIFLQVFLMMLVSISLIFVAGVFVVVQNGKVITQKRLSVEAELLSCLLTREEDITQLENYTNKDDFRITIIRENGEVLYESSIPGILESHADREEVKGALSGKPHTVVRYSQTFGCMMTYYAVSSTLENGDVIVIRIAVRSSEIVSYFLLAVALLLLTLILSLMLSGVLARRLSNNISMKIREIGESLKSLNAGEYHPLQTDSREKEFYSILCQINDLSEKTHRYLRTVTKEKQKLTLVLDNISEGIIALDLENRIVFANNSALDIFGDHAECVGKELIYLAPTTSFCEKVVRTANDQATFDYTNEGKEYCVTVNRITADEISGGVYAIVVITDVTKEKQIAKEKSDFFANASHELKTPITVMQGHSELLLSKGTLGEGERKQVERIHRECIRISSLISDMLKLSGLERKEQRGEEMEVSLLAVCREVETELSPLIREKALDFEIYGDAEIRIDSQRAYELISNLCTNAVKYNKDGGKIRIHLSQTRQMACMQVEDTGIGIEKEHLPRLCERFYRVDKSRSKKTGGTGLGLAIVKHICALYGASLHIDSEIGVGTRVTVTFSK